MNAIIMRCYTSRSMGFGGFSSQALQLSGHSLLRRKVKVELWTEGDLGAENKRNFDNFGIMFHEAVELRRTGAEELDGCKCIQV